MSDLKLGFGCNKALPDGVTTAWGARLIWPNDLVHDRQDLAGPNTDALQAWLNDGVLRSVLRMLAKPGDAFGLRENDDRTVVFFEDETGVIVGNPQSSYGYLYVAAWLKADVPEAWPTRPPECAHGVPWNRPCPQCANAHNDEVPA